MPEPTRTRELLDALARVLLRCWLFGFMLLLAWLAVFMFAGERAHELHRSLFGLTQHELNVISYCGVALAKLLVLLLFFFPWLAIRLVLRDVR